MTNEERIEAIAAAKGRLREAEREFHGTVREMLPDGTVIRVTENVLPALRNGAASFTGTVAGYDRIWSFLCVLDNDTYEQRRVYPASPLARIEIVSLPDGEGVE